MSKDLAELPTLTITYRALCNFLLSDKNLQAYGDSDDILYCTECLWAQVIAEIYFDKKRKDNRVDIPVSSLMQLFSEYALRFLSNTSLALELHKSISWGWLTKYGDAACDYEDEADDFYDEAWYQISEVPSLRLEVFAELGHNRVSFKRVLKRVNEIVAIWNGRELKCAPPPVTEDVWKLFNMIKTATSVAGAMKGREAWMVTD